MMIKSFMHKKTTKIYIITTILFALIISLSINFKNYYKKIINEYFEGSFYYISSEKYDSIYSKVKNKYKLNNLVDIVTIECDSLHEVNFYIDDSLSDDEVGVSKYFLEDNKDYSDIDLNRIDYNLNKNYDYDFKYQILAINSNTLNKIGKKYKNIYAFQLEDWSLRYEFETYFTNKFDDGITLSSTNLSNKASNYISLINILNVIPLILGIIYIIIFVILVVNIIKEDKNKNMIYSELGYSKRMIIYNNIIKVIIMLSFLIVPIFIFYFLINIFI